MLQAMLVLFLSFSAFAAQDYATFSLQRSEGKLIVTIDHEKGWHTYWKNPGDAGIASTFKYTKNEKPIETKAFEWPAPQRHIEAGDIMTIGYSGKQHFFFEDIPGHFKLKVGVLICKDICIPNEATLLMSEGQNFVSSRSSTQLSKEEIQRAFNSLPQDIDVPRGFEYYLTRVKGQNLLTLHYSIKGATSSKLPHELAFLTGFPHAPFGYKREAVFYKDGTLYGKTQIEWDGEYMEPAVALPENGLFQTPYKLRFLINSPQIKNVSVVTLTIKDFSASTQALDDFYKDLGTVSGKEVTVTSEHNYFEYLLFAFLGGLILNLMPCVLPVISLKLFGLIGHREYTQKKLLAHNLSYATGVIATFMALALIISGLKAGGEEIGWGFQLQSPAFILVMMIILFVMALNLFGLFEFATPGGSKLGGAKISDNLTGDFFSGVLTTILSTPCSAPFLGTALTFAFTTSYTTIFVMFFFIGLGLSSPFLLTAAFPGALKLFPRPGAWMEKLKYFLGLSLIATIIWLYDVFIDLVDYSSVGWRLNLLFALWFFAFFTARKITANRLIQAIFFALPIAMSFVAIQNIQLKTSQANIQESKSEWGQWSEDALIQNSGKTVFMDFTAEWCLTCKVNKKLVLETDGFKELKNRHNLTLLRADWTRRDDHITKFLRDHGAVGVPAYFIQKADGKIIPLGETLSISKIEENLN